MKHRWLKHKASLETFKRFASPHLALPSPATLEPEKGLSFLPIDVEPWLQPQCETCESFSHFLFLLLFT